MDEKKGVREDSVDGLPRISSWLLTPLNVAGGRHECHLKL